MFTRLRATLDPARYHGFEGQRPYFEGWYFKIVDASQHRRYAIIPGIFRGRDPAADKAFIQVLDGATGEATFSPLPISSFRAASDHFAVELGDSRFATDAIELNLDRPEGAVCGKLRFRGTTPWPVSVLSPGIMGWYAWVPFMECYHGVVSLDHVVEGSLNFGERTIDFSGGRGYTEKDWGRSFPAAWVWSQSNHFASPGTSFTASVAIIPWLRGAFTGFIVGLWHEGTLYRFATYTGARTESLALGDREIQWVVRDKRYRLEMNLAKSEGGLIQAPTVHDMDRRIVETMSASAHLRLSAVGSSGVKVVFEGTGHAAGLEVAGDLERLISLYQASR